MNDELQLAEEIANAVNDAGVTYSNSFPKSAGFGYFRPFVVEATSSVQVDIIPQRLEIGTQDSALHDRGSLADFWIIGLIVRGKIDPKNNADIRNHIKYVKELQSQILSQRNTYCMCWTTRMANDPIFDFEDLKNDSIFTSITEFEFLDTSRNI